MKMVRLGLHDDGHDMHILEATLKKAVQFYLLSPCLDFFHTACSEALENETWNGFLQFLTINI